MKFISIDSQRKVTALAIFTATLLASSVSLSGQTPTNIQISGTVQQPSVTRLGVNLGDQTYWDSGQILKNLGFRNPGFEGMKYRSIFKCSIVTANTCQDDNQYSTQPAGFWNGGTYLVLSGSSAGKTGVVSSSAAATSCAGCGVTVKFDQSINAAVGDYFSVTNYFPGNGDQGWWDSTSGGGSIATETNDLSPNTPGRQALVLNASGSGQSATVSQYWDTYTGHSFTQMNGTFQVTFRAKGIGGNNQLVVSVQRLQSGVTAYLYQTVTLTNAWKDYALTFSANETGSAVGNVQLAFSAGGGNVELDDTDFGQTNSSASNPTIFRDDVVNALKQLNPGTIRMMASDAALGSDLPNQLNVPFARYREGFNSGGHEKDDVAYGIHEFLQLCATVGSDPWITIPTATTPEEMTDFIEYLTGTGADSFSSLRISRGQAAPWTTVFKTIHIEFGNETWNGDFKGESMAYPGYPQWANQVFGAARATSGYEPAKFDLVIDGWAAVPGYNSAMLAFSTQHDSMDIAPYLLYSANNEPQQTMFGALFAEPEMFDTAGGEVYKNYQATQSAARATNLNIYESNLGSVLGSITQAQLDQLTPSIGAGIAQEEHMLQMMRLGIKVQNTFALPQYDFGRDDGSLVKLWGIVVDMGTTNRRRPQFLTEALGNSVIGGNMLQTVHTGTNPTWNQPLSSDSVQFNGAHYLQSFAFNNNGTVSLILFNLNQTTALPVTFSGANAPSGTVQMSLLTSASITDNNETANTVQATNQTLSGFNPSTPFSLPPFSMTVLTMNSTATQVPAFSIPGGSYTSSQTVSITDGTSSASIFYTTDGSTPTSSSTAYTGPITVSSSETLQALATAPGLSASAIGTASYVIGQATVATPTFSVAAGTYTSAQTVSITDATAGSAIYYTTNGSAPTASSTPYTGAITVSSTETINAIATASNSSASAVASATYTIGGTTATPSFSIAAGTYTSAQAVAIADATAGSTIYFTTNGTTPTTSSTQYTSPITVSTTQTINAIAVAPNYSASAVATAAYTISVTTATPIFSLPAGSYSAPQTVAITNSMLGATIYYTTDGTVPVKTSQVYTTPLRITATETIEAIAVGPYTQSLVGSAVASATYTISAAAPATPVLSPAGGTFTSAQTVVITDPTPATTIYYTTNGSAPTTSSAQYAGPITVSASQTINAIASVTSGGASAVASATYTINGATAAPTFSISSGAFASSQTVLLADATPNAAIYYTTNGTPPSASSTVYSGGIVVSSTETVYAIAIAPNYGSSSVVSATYRINGTTATPVFSLATGIYTSTQTVSISAATPGAAIYYTTNGGLPTTSSNLYTGPVTVSQTETIYAMAVAPNYTASASASATYAINGATAVPSFLLVEAETLVSSQTVVLTDATPGAAIYYTTDGSMPSMQSTRYTGPLAVTSTETIHAIAAAKNYGVSGVATATFDILSPASAPQFSIRGGVYSTAQTVAITDSNSQAVIHFTTNGSAPTKYSTIYTGPIKVGASETIQAVAVAPNFNPSSITAAAYTITAQTQITSTPIFSLPEGRYSSARPVSIEDGTKGAAIYYTLNGSTPTTSSTRYTQPFEVGKSETIKAIAIAPKYGSSQIATAAYSITNLASVPTFSVNSGVYSGEQTVVLEDRTAGATIYYTTNGLSPSTTSYKYVGPIKLEKTETLKAIAVAPGFDNSEVATAVYTIKVAEVVSTPAISVNSGTFSADITVTLKDSTPGAEIFYTLNGTIPTSASARYVGPIKISTSETLKALATAPNLHISGVATAVYNLAEAVRTPTFSLPEGRYSSARPVSIEDETKGATIYYTLNGSTPTTSSTRYTQPFEVAKSETIKAIAVAPKYGSSQVATAAYSITNLASVPTFSVKSGVYTTEQSIVLEDRTAGATIYYTTDGVSPNTKSYKYAGPIKLDKNETLKAIAVAPSFDNSEVATAVYTFKLVN